ncbi:MAG TPA: 50S ribosomal protein L30 [Egibacteraceae bacterium]|nr:50S ribosomal protein L30 [Egibacteraceae bacterium]
MADEIEITQVRSLIGSQRRQRQTLRSLGLRRMRQTVLQPDRPEIRGMVAKVAHLVEVRYPGQDAALDIEPGQEPKGEGNPPAGPSVEDEDAAELRRVEEEAVAVPGSADAGDLVQNPPTLTSTGAPEAPKAPQGGPEDEETDPASAAPEIASPDDEEQP